MIVMGSKMLIRVGYEFLFDVPSPVPILLKLYLHPSQLEKVNTVVGYAQGAPASVSGGLLTTPSNVLSSKDKVIEVPLPPHTVKKREELRIEPETAVEEFVDDFGNRVGRLVLPAGRVWLWNWCSGLKQQPTRYS